MPVSRRDFLKLGAVASSLVPLAQSLGVEVVRRSVAVVGAGVHGRRHLSVLGGLAGGEVVAIADACADTRRSLAESADGPAKFQPRIFCDGMELLAKSRPDILVCAIPGQKSAPVIAGALRAGCHVLVDHRRLLDVDRWRDLENVAGRSGRLLRIAAPWHADPAMEASVARAGREGGESVRRVHLECVTPFLRVARGGVGEEIADLFPLLHACMQLPFPDAPCSVFAVGSAGAASLRQHPSAPGFVAAVEWEGASISIRHRLAGFARGVGAEWTMTAESPGGTMVQRADDTMLDKWRVDEWRCLLSGSVDPAAGDATRKALALAGALAEAWRTGLTLRDVAV